MHYFRKQFFYFQSKYSAIVIKLNQLPLIISKLLHLELEAWLILLYIRKGNQNFKILLQRLYPVIKEIFLK
jgi:hypothetical protein